MHALVWPSLGVAGLVLLISAPAGVWLGWAVRRRPSAGALSSVPLLLPPTIVSAWLIAPSAFGWGVAVAAGVVFAGPLVFRAAHRAFRSLAPQYGNAARSLGAAEWRVLCRVELPLVWRPIVGAAGIAFARVAAEFALAAVLAARYAARELP